MGHGLQAGVLGCSSCASCLRLRSNPFPSPRHPESLRRSWTWGRGRVSLRDQTTSNTADEHPGVGGGGGAGGRCWPFWLRALGSGWGDPPWVLRWAPGGGGPQAPPDAHPSPEAPKDGVGGHWVWLQRGRGPLHQADSPHPSSDLSSASTPAPDRPQGVGAVP